MGTLSLVAVYVSIPFISVCVVFCTLFTIALLRQLNNPQDDRQSALHKHGYYYHIMIVCCMSSTLCEYCDLSRWIICVAANKSLFYFPMNQIMSIATFFHQAGAMTFYIVAISRIYIYCKTSYYPVSKQMMIIYNSILCIGSITAIYYIIIVALQPAHDTSNFFRRYNTIPSIILMVIDFILNTTLLILFFYKLRQLFTSNMRRNSILSFDNMEDEMNEKTETDINLIVRYCILFSIAVITNQIFFITVLVNHWDSNVRIKAHWLIFISRGIENVANCAVLFLSLNTNHGCYLCICSKCHAYLKNLFTGNTQRMLSQYAEDYELMEQEVEETCEQSIAK